MGMEMKWQYALLTKHKIPKIVVLSSTMKEFKDAIKDLYWNRKGMQPVGNNWTRVDMLKEYKIARICIAPLTAIQNNFYQ